MCRLAAAQDMSGRRFLLYPVCGRLQNPRRRGGAGGSFRASENSGACSTRARSITCDAGDLVPIGVVGSEENHRIMRGAGAERAGAGIKDARLAGIGIEPRFPVGLLTLAVRNIANEKFPAHGRIFRGERVEAWDEIIFREPRRARPANLRLAPTNQNVLINSIKARLSSSLNTGSGPNAFSSSLRPSVSLKFAVPK